MHYASFSNLLLDNNIYCFNNPKCCDKAHLVCCVFLFPFPPQRGAIVSEPAIQVRRKGKGTQVWTIEKLENKLIDMRDLYQEWKEKIPEVKEAKCQGDLTMLKGQSVSVLTIKMHTCVPGNIYRRALDIDTRKGRSSDLERGLS